MCMIPKYKQYIVLTPLCHHVYEILTFVTLEKALCIFCSYLIGGWILAQCIDINI